MNKQKIYIYGSSFNMPTNMHKEIIKQMAARISEENPGEKVTLELPVVYNHVFADKGPQKMRPFIDRVAMTQAMLEEAKAELGEQAANIEIKLSTFEKDITENPVRAGQGSVGTVEYIRAHREQQATKGVAAEYHYIVGMDGFSDFATGSWINAADIFNEFASITVINRETDNGLTKSPYSNNDKELVQAEVLAAKRIVPKDSTQTGEHILKPKYAQKQHENPDYLRKTLPEAITNANNENRLRRITLKLNSPEIKSASSTKARAWFVEYFAGKTEALAQIKQIIPEAVVNYIRSKPTLYNEANFDHHNATASSTATGVPALAAAPSLTGVKRQASERAEHLGNTKTTKPGQSQ